MSFIGLGENGVISNGAHKIEFLFSFIDNSRTMRIIQNEKINIPHAYPRVAGRRVDCGDLVWYERHTMFFVESRGLYYRDNDYYWRDFQWNS